MRIFIRDDSDCNKELFKKRIKKANDYRVKLGYESLANAAHFSGAQLALFGHTHEADFLRMGDVTLFNPGSAGMGRQTYGRITVKGTEFKCEILTL